MGNSTNLELYSLDLKIKGDEEFKQENGIYCREKKVTELDFRTRRLTLFLESLEHFPF